MVEILALIPARGGSKSIPRKNILSFGGYPLIAYSISAGLTASSITRVIVSTDDLEIASIAQEYGAEVPFLRPEECSQDQTPDLPVFQHALQWLQDNEGYCPQIVVQLRPTSPLRKVKHIDQAVASLMEHPQADAVRTVCVPFQNPYKMWQITSSGVMKPLLDTEFDEPYNMPRQELPTVFWQTGYVDAVRANTIQAKNSMTGELILPLVIEPEDWIDIDTHTDWTRAEQLIETGEISWSNLGFTIETPHKLKG